MLRAFSVMISSPKIINLLVFLLLVTVYNAKGQTVYHISDEIKWQKGTLKLRITESNVKETIFFKNATFDDKRGLLPVYFKKMKINKHEKITAIITKASYQTIADQDLYKNNKFIKDKIIVKADLAYEKKQPFSNISFIPIRKNPSTGRYEKLTGFELTCGVVPGKQDINSFSTRKKAAQSILAAGSWYKIGITKDGVYQIDYDFMESMGIDMNELNIQNIRLFGNGGGMLPEANSKFRYDGLQENAIKVFDQNGDNIFDDDDYILFYGQGPNRWYWNSTDAVFNHKMHLYSNYSYYFLTPDLGVGKQIISQSSTTQAYTHLVNEFDDYAFHELESVNLINSGRKWYGETFEHINSRNIQFNFPNIVPSSIAYIKSSVAARSTVASTFSVNVAGVNLTHSLDPIKIGYEFTYASKDTKSATFIANSDDISVSLVYNKPLTSAIGWLDYIELNVRRKLMMVGNQMNFRDISCAGSGNVTEYVVGNASRVTEIWDVSDPINVKSQNYTTLNNVITFRLKTPSLKEFVAFNDNSFLQPEYIGEVENQNIRGTTSYPEMLIVTDASFIEAANILADHHRNHDHINVLVTEVNEIYNEFSSGAQDISAIRDFAKMFYDRAGSDTSKLPECLLLFGDGSFDYKDRISNNTNYVPVYESSNSLSPTGSYTSDDFFGFLDNNEGGSPTSGSPLLDIAVGRLPVKTASEAQNVVRKIIHYATSPEVFGSWKNKVCFVGDDEDGNTHISSSIGSEALANTIKQNYPEYNIEKIYIDAYQQVATPGGSRYPDVNEAINNQILSGTFLMNYVGHGGGNGWAHERILEIDKIKSWNNYNKMPLFVTATCSFSAYDNSEIISPGELLILNEDGGAIAIISTARLVYSQSNYYMNNNLLKNLFKPVNGKMSAIGEIVRKAKNATSSDVNNRKFAFLGDPALTLGYPKHHVVTTKVNGDNISASNDTLKALTKFTFEGEVRDKGGTLLTDFNGIVYPTVYDKEREVTTLKNDPGSNITTFKIRKNIIYKGKASVKSGKFLFTFIVPKDIAYKFGNGKISYYTEDGIVDGSGYYDSIVVGGSADSFAIDNTGPEISLFLNDEKFVFGGITNENPTILIKLYDENGINTVGNGIGHDVTYVLDDDSKNTTVLNEFYEAELDNYQRGQIRYPLTDLSNGRHSLKIKAWDVYNNSSSTYTEFIVMPASEFSLDHVLNYPNPFTTYTEFHFEHNRPGSILNITLNIYSVSGKIVKSIHKQMLATGFRVDNITWNGLDEFGDKIGKGVYIYKLTVSTSDGSVANKIEKLYILQ